MMITIEKYSGIFHFKNLFYFNNINFQQIPTLYMIHLFFISEMERHHVGDILSKNKIKSFFLVSPCLLFSSDADGLATMATYPPKLNNLLLKICEFSVDYNIQHNSTKTR